MRIELEESLLAQLEVEDTTADPAGRVDLPRGTAAPVDLGAAFAIGSTVYLDGGRVRARIDDPTARGLLLTSAGLVVQGYDPDGDAGVTFVGPDGATRALDVPDTAFSTDPEQPLVAWTEEVDDVVTVVVLDVTTGERVAEEPVPDHAADFAPAALDGDHVYVGDGDRAWDVDLTSGAVTRSDVVEYVDEIAGGRTNLGYGGRVRVVDADSGQTRLEVRVPERSSGYFALSPDGRYARLVDQGQGATTAASVVVYDVDTGASVSLPNVPSYGYGWTADGRLIALSRDGVLSVCSPATGQCVTSTPDLAVRPYQYSRVDCSGDFARGCVPTSDGTSEDYRDDLVLAGLGGWS